MINKKNLQKIFISLVIIELLSFNAFLLENLMPLCFFAILIAAVVLSIKNLKYGLYIIFAELAVGSLGYLFWFDIFEFRVSIRIGLWLSVMSVYFFKYLFNFKIKEFKKIKSQIKRNSFIFWLILLFFSILWGIVNGYFQGNSLKNIFLDSNGWLFFSIIFPVFYVLKHSNIKKLKDEIFTILFTSVLFISLKTIFILYLFSHNFAFIPEIYRWIRDTRVGEITIMDSGFVRVFFQSHIYILTAFFAFFIPNLLPLNIVKQLKNKNYQINLILSSLFLSIIILGYSRSNWVGLILGLCIVVMFLVTHALKQNGFKHFFLMLIKIFFTFFSTLVISLFFIALIINFPFPNSGKNINSISLISERTSDFKTESGASSRWQLLPVLWKELLRKPILGEGFGATITYISNDPRVREKNIDGEYTTYAFEWGWLDIWLKLGFLGLIVYLTFLFNIIKRYYNKENKKDYVHFSFFLGLIIIASINIFSPYLNHPLGIGYIILLYLLFKK